jgi:phenylalanyl-tRNA synthetase beta chain
LYYLGASYALQPLSHPSFLDGRAGQILVNDEPIGVIGEVHPEVLEQWQATMPTVAFELAIDSLIEKK